MALQSSGQISLNDVNVELGNSGTAQIGLGDSAVRDLFDVASGEIEMSDGYGKASETVLTNEGTINGQSNRKEITVSNFISAGGTLVVPSGFWVWSDDLSTPAMIVDVACTIKNNGKIIGKGGQNNGTPGGDAIDITSSGVTIINYSGSYIAGGGAGGGQGQNGLGGGGAGGGPGTDRASYTGGAGGVLNAAGGNGDGGQPGYGGGAGGGGAGFYWSGAGSGGGGGRILPGSGGSGGGSGGAGGSAGNAGSNGANPYAGGGGGWGANGGNGYYQGVARQGGYGGNAVEPNSNSYTLTNNGTVYGATT